MEEDTGTKQGRVSEGRQRDMAEREDTQLDMAKGKGREDTEKDKRSRACS